MEKRRVQAKREDGALAKDFWVHLYEYTPIFKTQQYSYTCPYLFYL